ncbi:MAG TPA: protein-L-isoaspartate O-methyltransferase [Sphingomicrobium sp.]|nr:protein-L-isoaspartate O-methyltransferase [Sphingomicrobium sp.]
MSSPATQTESAVARQAMVDSQLRPQGVTDPQVLAAMGSVERERYVPETARALAYSDRSIPLGDGRSLPPPAALGVLLDGIRPMAGERALVIGAGTGYSSAVLEAMGLQVTAIQGARTLEAAGPVDVILIDGAVEFIPEELVAQLADGGRLGGALLEGGVARLILGRKAGDAFGYYAVGDAGVSPLPGFTRPPAFVF